MSDKICFVAMPFGDERRDPESHLLWTEFYAHIKDVIVKAGLRCIRADEISRPGNIICDIVRHLATADIVIAEMTGRNPNVFYELGVRHALSRRTILLAQKGEDIPFDLRPYRTITYRFTPRGAELLVRQLKEYIEKVLEEPALPDSPVQEYLATKVLQSDGKQPSSTAELERRIEEVKRQNFELAAALTELRSVVSESTVKCKNIHSNELSGTWYELEFPSHDEVYLSRMGTMNILAYEGAFPGCCWGFLQDHTFHFSWSRFDKSLSGKGYYRIDKSLTRLEGGIWFNDTDVDEMLRRGNFLERHAMSKKSVNITSKGQKVLRRAQAFLIQEGLLTIDDQS